MTNLYIGLDPGLTGGVAILDTAGSIVTLKRFDGVTSSAVLGELMAGINLVTTSVGLESVHARPGQCISSMFNFGMEFGRLQGFMDAHNLSYALYSPQAWQRYLPQSDTAKGRVKAWVEKTYGLQRFIFPGCRVPHSGCMDAAGIADYHRRVTLGLIEGPKAKSAAAVKRKKMMRF